MAYFFELSDIQSTVDGQIVTLHGDITRVDDSSGAGDKTFDLSNREHMVTIVMLDPLPVKVGMRVQVHNLIAIRHPHQALPVHFFAASDSWVSEDIIAPYEVAFQQRTSTMPPPTTASFTQGGTCCDAPDDPTCKVSGLAHVATCGACRGIVNEKQPYCSKQAPGSLIKCSPALCLTTPLRPSPFKRDQMGRKICSPQVAISLPPLPPKDDNTEEDPFQGHKQ